MTALQAMSALQSIELRHIDNVEPLNDDDEACLAEIRDVLERHGRTQRFGVALLHKHFELNDDELLVEHCDPSTRTLVIRPTNRTSLDETSLVKTIFAFHKDYEQKCEPYCPTDKSGRHQGRKDHL